MKAIALTVAIALPGSLFAETVSVPSGTRIFIELEQEVTSKKKHNRSGNIVRARVWRDVVVDGRTVVETGAYVFVKIGEITSAKVAGIKGHIELEALQVTAIDGSDIELTGGYDQSGKGRMALSISLAVFIFLPLIFIKGKQAKLPPGTLFDATVTNETEIKISDSQPPPVKPEITSPLKVEVLYEILEQQVEEKITSIPLQIQMDGEPIYTAQITRVNDSKIKPIPLEIDDVSKVGDNIWVATATADLKPLGKHFTRGINRFVVDVDGTTDEVMLDLEL
jgi:hypothetical protein